METTPNAANVANTDAGSPAGAMTPEERKVVFGASLGTVFEWYDFLLFGSLSPLIAAKFFSGLSPAAGFIFALLAFSVAYAVRPLGAIFFGRIGDVVGRKYTFLVTVSGMGVATFLIGALPTYATWGIAAPILLMILRVVQGLSIGGEFGGASTYVAEHAPRGRLGYFTGWVQSCAAGGFTLSLIVIVGTRTLAGESAFDQWAWRLPFLFSVVLLIVSVWIRMQLSESPIFTAMKQKGHTAKAPLKEAFGSWKNVWLMIVVMFGCVAGISAVGAMSLIYPLLFLIQTLKVDALTTNILAMLAIGVTIPLYPLVGWISDRIGRKPVIIAACLIAAVSYFPVVKAITHFANPAYEAALASAPVSVTADPGDCSFVFNPTGVSKFLSSCDIANSTLAREGVNYVKVDVPGGTSAEIRIGKTTIASFNGKDLAPAELKARQEAFTQEVRAALRAAGYPAKADPAQTNLIMVWLLMVYMAALMPLAYGASTAVMVELFPARIRYTTLSVPYHIGNWVSGFLIPIVFALVAWSGDIYFGLWYPIVWAVFGAIVVAFFIPETKDREIQSWY
jgi:MFS family permease